MTKNQNKSLTRFERFAVLMAMLQEEFCPDKPVSKRKIEFYYKMLEPFPIERIEKAAEYIALTKRIHAFPVLADFMDHLGMNDDSLEFEGLKLWNTACHLLLIPSYPSNDEILDRTVELAFGSWRNFGQTRPDESWDRTHFIRCYKIVMKGRDEKLLEEGKERKLKP